MLSLAIAAVVAEPSPPMVYVGGSLGCLRKTEETQKEKMALVAVRMMLVNTNENYTDPNSFWTNH